MNIANYVLTSDKGRASHILTEENIRNNSFKTACGIQLGENIYLANPKNIKLCKKCSEIKDREKSQEDD